MPRGLSPVRRPLMVAAGVMIALSMVMAACGGGGDGGGGGGGIKIHILVVNGSSKDVTVGYTSGGQPQPDKPLKTCTSGVYDYPVADPFQVMINGAPALDSASAQVPGYDSDLTVELDIDSADKVTLASPGVSFGRFVSPPSEESIC